MKIYYSIIYTILHCIIVYYDLKFGVRIIPMSADAKSSRTAMAQSLRTDASSAVDFFIGDQGPDISVSSQRAARAKLYTSFRLVQEKTKQEFMAAGEGGVMLYSLTADGATFRKFLTPLWSLQAEAPGLAGKVKRRGVERGRECVFQTNTYYRLASDRNQEPEGQQAGRFNVLEFESLSPIIMENLGAARGAKKETIFDNFSLPDPGSLAEYPVFLLAVGQDGTNKNLKAAEEVENYYAEQPHVWVLKYFCVVHKGQLCLLEAAHQIFAPSSWKALYVSNLIIREHLPTILRFMMNLFCETYMFMPLLSKKSRISGDPITKYKLIGLNFDFLHWNRFPPRPKSIATANTPR